MKRNVLAVAICLMFIFACKNAIAVQATGTPPIIRILTDTLEGVPLSNDMVLNIQDSLNAQLSRVFMSTVDSVNQMLARYKDQTRLAKGFANATSYSASSGIFLGIDDYDRLQISAGGRSGVQLPSLSVQFRQIPKEIMHDPNIMTGFAIGVTYLNIGYSWRKYLPGFYTNVNGGYYSYQNNNPVSPSSLEDISCGVSASYTVRKNRLIIPHCQWIGFTLGSGMLYHSNVIKFSLPLGGIWQRVPFSESPDNFITGLFFDNDPEFALTPMVKLSIDSKTFTVPIDFRTSILTYKYFKVNGLAGCDVNFGSSTIAIRGSSTTRLEKLPETMQGSNGTIAISGGTSKAAPSFVNFKIGASIGGQWRFLKVEVPFIFIAPSAYTWGITGGLAF